MTMAPRSDRTPAALRPRPDGRLLRVIPRLVARCPGGGCSVPALARACGVLDHRDPVFQLSLLVCRRRGQVDYTPGRPAYVTVPLPGGGGGREDAGGGCGAAPARWVQGALFDASDAAGGIDDRRRR